MRDPITAPSTLAAERSAAVSKAPARADGAEPHSPASRKPLPNMLVTARARLALGASRHVSKISPATTPKAIANPTRGDRFGSFNQQAKPISSAEPNQADAQPRKR